MKKIHFFRLTVLFFIVCVGITSCRDRYEKEPEIVVDPIVSTIEYYVSGKVVSEDAPLGGVTVSIGDSIAITDAEGNYTLTVTEKKTYGVIFEKTGYLSISDAAVEVLASSTNRSTVFLNVSMAKMGVATAVNTTRDVTITELGEGANSEATTEVNIPAGAVSESVEVTVTPYSPPPPSTSTSTSTPGSSEEEAALTNVSITTSAPIVLEQDITLSVNNKAASTSFFTQIEVHQRESSSASGAKRKVSASANAAGSDEDWVKVGNAVFNATTNTYDFVIGAGKTLSGDYSFRVNVKRTVGAVVSSEINTETTQSNAGNTDAIKGYTINYSAKAGWDYTSSFTGIDSGLAAMIRSVVAGNEGGTNGFYSVAKTFTTDISGGYIMYYRSNAKYVTITYVFNVNGGTNYNVTVKHYTGMVVTYTNTKASQHSGGGAN